MSENAAFPTSLIKNLMKSPCVSTSVFICNQVLLPRRRFHRRWNLFSSLWSLFASTSDKTQPLPVLFSLSPTQCLNSSAAVVEEAEEELWKQTEVVVVVEEAVAEVEEEEAESISAVAVAEPEEGGLSGGGGGGGRGKGEGMSLVFLVEGDL
ncbi:hypothetical protein [Arabidopsis thaliana]|uniref:Uncharacterized protein AT4g18570 n=1 Tax=Arabidopsis thaliana TaxID=3702 RepID=O49525_ARATH|nr:hypothetical protein [Arabidopsis thaliana]CAB78859.1 hypothetical protein [Arabidopsis thaliana]